MAHFEILLQRGHVDHANNQEMGDEYVVIVDGPMLVGTFDSLVEAVQRVDETALPGDRLTLDITF